MAQINKAKRLWSNSTYPKLNEGDVYTVQIWRENSKFPSHRISPFIAICRIILVAKNKAQAYELACAEFSKRYPYFELGSVVIYKGFHPSSNDKTENIILNNTFDTKRIRPNWDDDENDN